MTKTIKTKLPDHATQDDKTDALQQLLNTAQEHVATGQALVLAIQYLAPKTNEQTLSLGLAGHAIDIKDLIVSLYESYLSTHPQTALLLTLELQKAALAYLERTSPE